MPFIGVEGAKDIECAVCLDPWDNPVELEPCGHVFCQKCAQPLAKCPDCRADIRGRKNPNRILVNMANEAAVRCETCGWQGSREASRTHRCGAGPPAGGAAGGRAMLPPAGPALAAPSPPFQPPAATWAPPPQSTQAHVPHFGGATGGHTQGEWTKYGLTQDQYDHIMMVFMTFDTDDSGELDRREVTTLCRWLNYAHSDRDIDAMFRAMDTDGSGSLSMAEFCRWISTHRPDPTALYGLSHEEYETTLFAFHSYDRDNNGILNQQEFAQLALRQQWVTNPMEAEALFASIDTDRNGGVDLHETLCFMSARRHGRAVAPPGAVPLSQSGHFTQSQFNASASMPAPLQWQQQQGQPPLSQQQQPPSGYYPPQQQQPLPQCQRRLQGRIVELELGHANVDVFVGVSPNVQLPTGFRTPVVKTDRNGRATFNVDFVLPLSQPNDSPCFRVFRAMDGVELCGAVIVNDKLGVRSPNEDWGQLHPRDPSRFNVTNARIRLRLQCVG